MCYAFCCEYKCGLKEIENKLTRIKYSGDATTFMVNIAVSHLWTAEGDKYSDNGRKTLNSASDQIYVYKSKFMLVSILNINSKAFI